MKKREIEFRAWTGKIWTKEFSLFSDGTISSRIGGFSLEQLPELIISEYTGIKDYKGKKIFEYDILWANSKHWKVVFSGGSFVAWGPGRWKAIPNLWQPTIVGDLYENPKIICYR